MSPLFASLLVVVGVFTVLGRLRALLAIAPVPGNRADRMGELLATLPTFGLGQKRMVDRDGRVPRLMHVFIFSAFMVFSIRAVMLFVMGFSSTALEVLTSLDGPAWVNAPTWKAVYAAYLFVKDVAAVLGLLGVSYFAYLRAVTKAARVSNSNEALILGFIGTLTVTELLFGGSLLAESSPWEPVTSVVAAATREISPDVMHTLGVVCFWIHLIIIITFLNFLLSAANGGGETMASRKPIAALVAWGNPDTEASAEKALRPRETKPMELPVQEPLALSCAGCGKAYVIGRDAILVTLDLALNRLARTVTVFHEASASSAEPDLVESADTVPAERRAAALAEAGETARSAIISLKQGRARRWRCNKCRLVNDYPILDAQPAAANQPSRAAARLALMECPPFSGSGVCSDESCPCSSTAIPPAKGYLYLSQELCDFRQDCLGRVDAEAKYRHMADGLDSIQRMRLMLSKILFPILVCEEGARLRGLDLEVASMDYDTWVRTSKVPCRPTPLQRR